MDKNKKTTSNVLQTIETKDKILKKSYKYCKFRYVVHDHLSPALKSNTQEVQDSKVNFKQQPRNIEIESRIQHG